MQVVDTQPETAPAGKTRRATKAAKTSSSTTTKSAKTSAKTSKIEAMPAAEAVSEGTPKRTRTRKSAPPAEAAPLALVAEVVAPKRTRGRKAVAADVAPKVAPVGATEAASVVEAAAPKRTRSRKSAASEAPVVTAASVAEVATEPVVEAPKRTRARKPVAAVVAPAIEAALAVEAAPKRTRTRKAATAEAPAAEAAPTVEAAPVAEAPAPKRTRKAARDAAAAKAAPAAAPIVEVAPTPEPEPAFVPTIRRVPAPAHLRRRRPAARTAERAPVADAEPEFVPTIRRVPTPTHLLRGRSEERREWAPEEPRRQRLRRDDLVAELNGLAPRIKIDTSKPVKAFGELPLSAPTARSLEAMGYETPTEIQAKTIPLLLNGQDVMGQAQTGTGKTAAFGIPLVERIDTEVLVVQALVLAPTRELAMQISQEVGKIGSGTGVSVAPIYGGAQMGPQFKALERGAQVVVGTPGRILDHMRRGTLSLESVRYLVLDEADRMLDMGFMPDVEKILRRTPRDRQTALFSATLPTVVKIISRRHMRQPVHVQVKAEERTVSTVDQFFYEVAERDKPEALRVVLQEQTPERAMIFCRTQFAVDRLTRILQRDGLPVEAIHGSMNQKQRERVMADFRRGEVTLLVATNLAARGLDIPEVSHVINYDIPEESESYVHRIGRTARMGREGMAITFVAEWDEKSLAEIRKVTNGALRQERLSLYA